MYLRLLHHKYPVTAIRLLAGKPCSNERSAGALQAVSQELAMFNCCPVFLGKELKEEYYKGDWLAVTSRSYKTHQLLPP
jgi:hypothetical protein